MSINKDEKELVRAIMELQQVIALPTFAENRATENLAYYSDGLVREMMVTIGRRNVKEFLEN